MSATASSKVVGIDLGTTNSCVAVMEAGGPVVIPNRGGYKTTPSMIAVTEAGKRLVGHMAKRQAITNAEHTVFAAKRFIGRPWDSPQVQHASRTAPYRMVEGPHGDVRVQLRDRGYAVPEISATILQEMKIIAEDFLGEAVGRAVITVPAYFNDNQRQATKDAGAIAGLEVIRIINEPTAAALAYGYGKSLDRCVAIYDLGGGTVDISILEVANGVFRVIATAGDTFLGGEDFDARIVDWLVAEFRDQTGLDLRNDRMALQRCKDAAEKAKCELSGVKETQVRLPFLLSGLGGEALHLDRTLARAKVDELCADLIVRSIEICAAALEGAGLEKDEIEDVVLVGGMTRMPAVQAAVAEFFGRAPSKGVHPDEVVALGAAIQASALVERKRDSFLLDVTPHTLGIMVAGGLLEEVIPQNSSVPTSRMKSFTTTRDNQTAVKVLVLQGPGERAEENELLGEFTLTGLRALPKGQVEVVITFDINADGIVSVSARDRDTGLAQSITVTARSGLTGDELKRMIEEGREQLVTRRVSEEMQATEQEAQALLTDIDRLLPDVIQSVGASPHGREAIEKANAVIMEASVALDARDIEGLGKHMETLRRTARMFRGVVAASGGEEPVS